MKVTAILPDDIVADVKSLTKSKKTTEALIKALSDWISSQKLRKMNSEIIKKPLVFSNDFSADLIRNINRE
jgi:hypothetical protein